MAKQTINIGTSANDGTGDPLRTAFDKINDNFDEIYTELGGSSLSNLKLTGNKLISDNTNGDIELDPDGNGKVIINADFEVKGTTTQMNATVMQVEDNLVEFNRNSSGTDIDAGMYINRGGAGNNAVFYWNEGDDKFKAVLSSSASTATAVNDTSTATIVANFEGDSLQINTVSSTDSSVVTFSSGVMIEGICQANTLETDTISSHNSTAITVSEAMIVEGTLYANNIDTNKFQNSDSASIEFDTDVRVLGNLHADEIIVNTLYSNDSTAIQINDGLDVTGTIKATTITGLNGSTLTFDAPTDFTGSIGFAVVDNYASSTVALNLDASVHALGAGDSYTLADGNEGQIIYFAMGNGGQAGSGVATVVVLSKYRNVTTGAIDTSYSWNPFSNGNSLAVAVFASGAWCTNDA